MLWITLIVFFLTLLLGPARGFACTTVLVGKQASESGEVWVGHNEDSGGRYVMHTHLLPPLERLSSETIRFEQAAAELPLPQKRARLFWSEARPYIADGGASFCDFFVNGNGVVLCSDNCGKPKEDKPELTDGGIGYGIRRLTAEGARSAYHAVEIAADLVARYGYIGNGRSYHFADKNEIWVFQVVNGKKWAVKRVPDDHVYVNPNHLTIRTPDEKTPGLEELIAYATLRGWYNPEGGEVFDFAKVYQAPEAYRAIHNLHRHLRALEIILGHSLDPSAELPFSVLPPRKIGISDIKKVLRCHFEGTSSDVSGSNTPHYMKTRPICASTTLESTIVQIRDNHDMTIIRRALGRPCLSVYIPWYFGMDSVPPSFGKGNSEEAVSSHFSVPPAELDYSKDEAWFHYTDLQAAVDPLYAEQSEGVSKQLRAFEETVEAEVRAFDPLAEGHFKTDAVKGRALLSGSVEDWGKRALAKIDELYGSMKVLSVDAPKVIDVNSDELFSVSISLQELKSLYGHKLDPERLLLDKTLFAPHYAPLARRSRAEKAVCEGDKLRLSFRTGEWKRNSTPCLTDMWLSLEDADGGRAVGKALALLTPEATDCKEETSI